MAHLSPSAIFSPSVAKQQAAASKDWSYIDHFLSTKFHPSPVPPFERNTDTLRILLALAAQNETADEERDLLSSIQSTTLFSLRAETAADPNASLLQDLEESLTTEGHAALDVLAELSMGVGLAMPDTEKLAKRMIDLQITAYDLEQASTRVSILETHLDSELSRITKLVEELQSEAYQVPNNTIKETTDYQRKTKVLASKLPELRDRVAASQALVGKENKITIESVKREEESFKTMLTGVKDIEAQLKGYHGLPQDTDLARLELEGLRVELRELIGRRDRMFEGLVERETPRKPRS